MPEVTEKTGKRFDSRDFSLIAEAIVEEYNRRQRDPVRVSNEKHWKEIDRQLRMDPDISSKRLANGEIDAGKRWMAERLK